MYKIIYMVVVGSSRAGICYISVQLREISCDAVSSRKVPHICDGRTTAGRCRAVQVAEQPISERLLAVQVAFTQLFNRQIQPRTSAHGVSDQTQEGEE